ncbi:hypothetical protein NGM33_07235 [Nocardiopsis dassonvillei]|uniref:hypothetical protein n=1 Tax=Nocardiopsis dassonvillei TaxID=2014 RepID=UPI0020A2A95B|nr:hypothetical protein [Nocardiopsis dassonvillei]MCP3013123.1 hypothetical protein [Nocardiopsis dassonvillei]
MSLYSPLSLLHEWNERTDRAPLREFLLTGFTMDLPFLERAAVPMARGLGAAVTLVGDAAQSRHDPVDVRRAGRDYTHALASCGGSAFHPKLALLLGDHEVVAAIGSGNPTLAGWGHNDELWTVLRGGPDGMPWELTELAAWLRGCAGTGALRLPGYMGDRLGEVAGHLEELLLSGQPDETGARVVHNLDLELIEQLDAGPVDELCLYAPFVDPGARALRALVERLDPARVVLGVQESSGSYDGDVLARALAGTDAELRLLEEKVPRHGKLVEWSAGEGRWALTGSANLTGAALLRSTRAGGNCELGTVVPVGASLMPEATALPVSRLAGVNTIGRFERGHAPGVPVPLGAFLKGESLVVTLADAHSADVVVESSRHGSPGTWEDVGTIRAGETEGTFATWGGGGLVVRVRVPDGRASAPVFTVDPRRCARPSGEDSRPRMRRAHTEESLFDGESEREFQRDILRLAEELASHGLAGTAPRGTAAAENRSDTVEASAGDRWTEYLEDCERTFGVPLTVSMFGRRTPAASPDGSKAGEERWNLAGAREEDEEGVQEEAARAVQEERAPGKGLTEQEKRRWRGWTRRAVNACVPDEGAPVPPLPVRLLVTRVVVRLLGAGVWSSEDESWRPELARLALGLVREKEAIPDQALEQACLVTAVCAGLLLEDVPLNAGTSRSQEARTTWSRLRERVALADSGLDSGLLLVPGAPHARVLGPAGLERVIRLAWEDDPLVHVREELLETSGWTLETDSGVHRVHGDFTNPVPVAARVAEILEEHVGPVIVHAQGPKAWALLVWSRPRMLLASRPRGSAWRLYRVDPPATPSSRLGGEGLSRVGLLRTSAPLHLSPHPDVSAFLESLGTGHLALLEKVGFLHEPL